MNELWNRLAEQGRVSLAGEQHERLSRYLALLLEANQRMNLTRITDPAAAEVHHVGDALTLLRFLPSQPHHLADIGSGGGVPGIPVAIARPDAQVMLIESTKKKAAFLRECARELGLANVTVRDERAEEVGHSELRETFDVVTARAVGELVWLVEWGLPLVRKGGSMLAMKGQRVNEELPAAYKAIRALNGGEAEIHPVELPGTEHHVIVRIPKLGRSDRRYPRPATVAKGKRLFE